MSVSHPKLIPLKLFSILFWSTSIAWFFHINGYSQATKALTAGIHFQAGTFKEAQQIAKLQQKPLFIKVYLTGCPHCEALAPVLTEKAIGDFFNKNFVNWQVEANQPESKALQNQLGITYPEFPLLLFVSPEGKLIHLATPAEQPNRAAFVNEVLNHAKTALEPSQRSSSYASRFTAGEQDMNFLIQAGKYWKATRDTLHLNALNDVFAHALAGQDAIVSPLGLYVLNRFINDFQNPLAQYFFTHLPQFKAKFPAKDVLEAGESVLYNSLFGAKANQWPPDAIGQMRQAMISLGTPAGEAMNRTLVPELEALLRARQTATATDRVVTYCHQNPAITPSSYAYFMHLFNQKATDTSYLPQMQQWANAGLQGLKAKPDAAVAASLHYELALAQQKEGNRQAASENARKGLAFAKASKLVLTQYEQLLAQLL